MVEGFLFAFSFLFSFFLPHVMTARDALFVIHTQFPFLLLDWIYKPQRRRYVLQEPKLSFYHRDINPIDCCLLHSERYIPEIFV